MTFETRTPRCTKAVVSLAPWALMLVLVASAHGQNGPLQAAVLEHIRLQFKHEEDGKRMAGIDISKSPQDLLALGRQLAEEWKELPTQRAELLNWGAQLTAMQAQRGGEYPAAYLTFTAGVFSNWTALPPDAAMSLFSVNTPRLGLQFPGEEADQWAERRRLLVEGYLSVVARGFERYDTNLVQVRFEIARYRSAADEADAQQMLSNWERHKLDNEQIYYRRELQREQKKAQLFATRAYASGPYRLDELQMILDKRTSDADATKIMDGVFKALPKPTTATLPRPIPHAPKANQNPGGVGTGNSGLPAIARPSKLRDSVGGRGSSGSVAPGASGKSARAVEPAGGEAGQSGERPLWHWLGLGVAVVVAGGIWLRAR